MRDIQRAEYEEEGRATKAKVEADRQKILLIRNKKLDQPKQMPMNIPEEYKEKLVKKTATF